MPEPRVFVKAAVVVLFSSVVWLRPVKLQCHAVAMVEVQLWSASEEWKAIRLGQERCSRQDSGQSDFCHRQGTVQQGQGEEEEEPASSNHLDLCHGC
jgi:hypothetical protein